MVKKIEIEVEENLFEKMELMAKIRGQEINEYIVKELFMSIKSQLSNNREALQRSRNALGLRS